MKIDEQVHASVGMKRPAPSGTNGGAEIIVPPAMPTSSLLAAATTGAQTAPNHSGTNGFQGGESNGITAKSDSGGLMAAGGVEIVGVSPGTLASTAEEPVSKRLKPQDPDLQIHEVTNDGDAANMEMLIHLKVCNRRE